MLCHITQNRAIALRLGSHIFSLIIRDKLGTYFFLAKYCPCFGSACCSNLKAPAEPRQTMPSIELQSQAHGPQ